MPTTITADGVELAWDRRGEGPRVLLCLGSNMTVAGSAGLLGLLARDITLLTFDYRGMGASGPAPVPYGMDACAADALAVLDAAGWATARVVGVSFGGMVAQELAVTAPDRIERLALLCTSPGGAGGSSYPLLGLEALTPAERASARRELLDDRWDEAWLAAHPDDRALLDLLVTEDSDGDPAVVAGRHAQLVARRDHDVWDRLHAVTCPTLVAGGRFDPIAPLANSAAIASRIAGAELRAYDGGHAFFVQDRRAVADLAAFLHADGT